MEYGEKQQHITQWTNIQTEENIIIDDFRVDFNAQFNELCTY